MRAHPSPKIRRMPRWWLCAGTVLLNVVAACATEGHGETWSTWGDARGATAQPRDSSATRAAADTPNAEALSRRPAPRAEPELPRVLVDTRLVEPTGRRWMVKRGDNLQAALNAAQPGDVVLLESGARFAGHFNLPAKTGTGWITIRSAAPDAALPPVGTRITPSFSAVMPKIVSMSAAPALRTAPGAHHYRIIGIEFTVALHVRENHGIVTLGEGSRPQLALHTIPTHIILDRTYIHGHSTLHTNRCIALNSAMSAVIDSYISECHAKGFDSQAVCGWNGPGPFKIVNNYLEGAGENVMFGGADPSIPDLTPSDIEIRRNHFSRPASWKGVWTVKNLLELKHARRVLVEGNVFENHWVDAQNGFAIVWFSANQDGKAPWSVVRDVTFRHNKLRNAGAGISIGAGAPPSVPASRMRIVDNLFERINVSPFIGTGRLFQVIQGVDNVTIEHNTTFTENVVLMFDVMPQRANFTFSNNLTTRGEYGIVGSGAGEGVKALTHYLASGYRVERNVLIGPGNGTTYPAGNFFPRTIEEVGFVNVGAGNYRLSARSPYKKAGTDGRDPGADIDAIETATKGVVLP
jgi:hypothetical protein